MSTFQQEQLSLNKTFTCDKNRLHLTKRTNNSKPLSLTQRGLNQAHRNDSTDMWKLIHNWQQQTEADSWIYSSARQNKVVQQLQQKSFTRSSRQPQKSIHSDFIKQLDSNQNGSNQRKSESRDQTTKIKKQLSNNKKSSDNKTIKNNKTLSKPKNQPNKDELENLKFQNLEKMNNQIKKHLQKQKFASRTLSNSAFAKLYNRPCVQSYGYGNTTSESIATNNLLKTHNITPHTISNKPQTYQTYRTALLYGKRSKINEQDKQQRLRRQYLRWFDDSIIEEAQIQLWKKNQLRKSKSQQRIKHRIQQIQRNKQQNNQQALQQKKQKRKSLKQLLQSKQPVFVYRHTDKDGQVKISTDRHGISCYVDSGYLANETALINFKKNQKPIYPQKVDKQDMNIDLIRKLNYQKSVQKCHPGHYLTPVVQAPYDRNKYQFRKKRSQSTAN